MVMLVEYCPKITFKSFHLQRIISLPRESPKMPLKLIDKVLGRKIDVDGHIQRHYNSF